MDIGECVERAKRTYNREIKPLIDQGSYEFAGLLMNNLIFLIDENRGEVVRKFDFGLGYVVSAKILTAQLMYGEKPSCDEIQRFETCQRQLKFIG